MTASYTIAIIGPAGGGIQQWAVSRKAICLAIAFGVLMAGAIAALGADYFRLCTQADKAAVLDHDLKTHQRLIAMQRQQVQEFAQDINALKSRLVEIHAFEKKIRVIANIDNDDDASGLFGMGGAPPEDLDARLPLTQEHGALMRDMHEQVSHLSNAAARQRGQFSSLLKNLEAKIDLLAATPSIRPATGWITSRFGKRTSPFTGRPEFHRALDIASDIGTPIVATADGVVSFSGRKWLLGNVVVIDHGHGMVTRYAHCDNLLKKRGDAVRRGDTIAKMGNSGRSTGPHLHYEVRLNGLPVNPEIYILN